jgi:hypothetical protein
MDQEAQARLEARKNTPLERRGGSFKMGSISEDELHRRDRAAMLELSPEERFRVLEELRRNFYGDPPTRQQLHGFYQIVKRKIG